MKPDTVYYRGVRKQKRKRCQICCWLFKSLSTLRARPAKLFSFSILPFMDKQAELSEEHFSSPNTLPMSVNLCPPKVRHRYIAIARATFSRPRHFFPSSSRRRRGREGEGEEGEGVKSLEGVKSFVASCWHLLEPSLTCFAPDEIQFVGQSTMSQRWTVNKRFDPFLTPF